jgi:prevent-host-death family protein
MEVGVRDLKNNLSRYLTRVGAGDEVVVTDRGRPVARIIPIATERTIDRLIAEGLVTPGATAKQSAPTARIRPTEPVSPLVIDQRH